MLEVNSNGGLKKSSLEKDCQKVVIGWLEEVGGCEL